MLFKENQFIIGFSFTFNTFYDPSVSWRWTPSDHVIPMDVMEG